MRRGRRDDRGRRRRGHGPRRVAAHPGGDVDLLGEIVGGGGYEQLRDHAITLRAFGRDVSCLGLEKLIEVKRAAGRPKDFEAIAELEVLLSERRGT